MAEQNLLAKLGLRLGVLGSAASLAIAAPLATGNYDPVCSTSVDRIGAYFDRTPGLEKIGLVVMGTEGLAIAATGITTPSITLGDQAANMIFAGPASGGADTPGFRGIVADDLPLFSDVTAGAVSASGGGTTNFLRADGTWTVAGTINGTVAANQIAYGSALDTLASSASFQTNGTVVAIGGPVSTSTNLLLPAATTGASSFRMPHGVVPTTPVNGDMWTTTAGLFAQINGATIGPFSDITGSVEATQVVFGTATDVIDSSANLIWDEVNLQLRAGEQADFGLLFSSQGQFHARRETGNATVRATTVSDTHASFFVCDRYRGTFASPSAVMSGDQLGDFLSLAYDGAGVAHCSELQMVATENWNITAHGSKTIWYEIPNGTITQTVIMEVSGTGVTMKRSGSALSLDNVTSAWIDLGAGGIAPPTFTTRSVGTKLLLFQAISGSQADYSIGINAGPGTIWMGVPTTAQQFQWFGGTTVAATLTGDGALTTTAGVTCTALTDSGLTNDRIIFAGTAGLLMDSSTFTFTSSTQALVLTQTAPATGANSRTAGSFTSTRAPADIGGGTLTAVHAVANMTGAGAAGNTVQLIGVDSLVQNSTTSGDSGALIGYNLNVHHSTSSGTVSAVYGLLLNMNAVTGTVSGDKYGVYQLNAAVPNFMAGALGVGNEIPSTTTAFIVPAATTGVSSLRIPHGVAPTAPVNGDLWSTTAGFFGRVNGVTVGPFGSGGGITGSGVAGYVTYWDGTSSVTGSSAFQTDGSVVAIGGPVDITTKLLLPAADEGYSSLRIPQLTIAPIAPLGGDVWTDVTLTMWGTTYGFPLRFLADDPFTPIQPGQVTYGGSNTYVLGANVQFTAQNLGVGGSYFQVAVSSVTSPISEDSVDVAQFISSLYLQPNTINIQRYCAIKGQAAIPDGSGSNYETSTLIGVNGSSGVSFTTASGVAIGTLYGVVGDITVEVSDTGTPVVIQGNVAALVGEINLSNVSGASITIPNVYSLYLPAPTIGDGYVITGLPWGVYQDGATSINFFAGRVGIVTPPQDFTALQLPPATTTLSSFRMPHGTAPTSPVDGDFWTTTAGVFAQIDGSTLGLLAGTGAANKVAYWSGVTTLASDAGFSFTPAGDISVLNLSQSLTTNSINPVLAAVFLDLSGVSGGSGHTYTALVCQIDDSGSPATASDTGILSLVSCTRSSTNTISNIYGASIQTFVQNNGGTLTLTNNYGLSISCAFTNSGTAINATNVYGIDLDLSYLDQTNTTNAYGLRIVMVDTGNANQFGIYQISASASNYFEGSIKIAVAGNGLFIAEGSDAKMGISTLSGGTITVSTTAVTANSRIFITSNVDGGTVGSVRVNNIVPGTSFDIVSLSAIDTSDVAWLIVEPA